jgi:hypothetical protein
MTNNEAAEQLQRMIDWRETRLLQSDKPLSYFKAEIKALQKAVALLKTQGEQNIELRRVIADQRTELARLRTRTVYEEDVKLEELQ